MGYQGHTYTMTILSMLGAGGTDGVLGTIVIELGQYRVTPTLSTFSPCLPMAEPRDRIGDDGHPKRCPMALP